MNYVIRDLTSARDMEALEEIQEKSWGYGDREILPGAMFVVSAHSGGVVAAAYTPSNDPVGFVYGVPAVRPGKLGESMLIHHSHMLAIVPEHRGSGLAQLLKMHQRERAKEMGYSLITWTADPLVARNARLNLGKLSARAVSYHDDWYASRDVYAGLPADRFMIEWSLETEPTAHPMLEASGPRALESIDGNPKLGPRDPDLGLDDSAVLVEVPRDIDGLKRDSLAVAQAWRNAHRVAFAHYFGQGYTAVDLSGDGDRLFYRLERGCGDNPFSRTFS